MIIKRLELRLWWNLSNTKSESFGPVLVLKFCGADFRIVQGHACKYNQTVMVKMSSSCNIFKMSIDRTSNNMQGKALNQYFYHDVVNFFNVILLIKNLRMNN